MENNTPNKGGFWMLVEELSDEFFAENNSGNESQLEKFTDTDEFFPDTSF